MSVFFSADEHGHRHIECGSCGNRYEVGREHDYGNYPDGWVNVHPECTLGWWVCPGCATRETYPTLEQALKCVEQETDDFSGYLCSAVLRENGYGFPLEFIVVPSGYDAESYLAGFDAGEEYGIENAYCY